MKKTVSFILFITILIGSLLFLVACEKKSQSPGHEYAAKYKEMNKEIVTKIEKECVDYSSGWCKFSSSALGHANSRCGNPYKDISSFSKLVVTKGQIGGRGYDSDPYTYVVHGYIVGSDIYGRSVQYNCNLILNCSLETGEILYNGIEIDR